MYNNYKFHEMVEKGIERIYSEGLEAQQNYITKIAREVRHMKDPGILFEAKGFFVPNNDYMVYFFGEEILDPSYDCYNFDGNCSWYGYLVFPMYDIVGRIIGFNGFNPRAKLLSLAGEGDQFYRHSGSVLLDKTSNMFGMKGVQQKAIEDGYLIITDGLFDTLSLANESLNAESLLGSNLSKNHLAFLAFVDRIYLAMDGDSAGLKLARALLRGHKGVSIMKWNKYKDIDGVLKSQHRLQFLDAFELHRKKPYIDDLILEFVD
ncbi:hypothetical protein UT300012_23540 [Paraclostridium bifermentans]